MANTIPTAEHLRAMLSGDALLEHLTKDHGAKSVPVSKAQQAKLHTALHISETMAGREPEARAEEQAPEEQAPEPQPDHAEPIGPLSEVETLKAALAAALATPAPVVKSKTYGAPEAKNELFRLAVQNLDWMVGNLKDDDPILSAMDRAEVARVISQAIHHFATGRDDKGARIWPATTLPRPQRSDWK